MEKEAISSSTSPKMQHKEDTFKAADGLSLFEQSWLPQGNLKGTIVVIHGYAEHSSRYKHVAEYLADNGYNVCAFDLRGHGKSEGARAFVFSFDEYLSDLEVFLAYLGKRQPLNPIFLLGHSMGGTIVTLFSITREPDVQGLILSSPLLKLPSNHLLFSQYMALITGIIFPKQLLTNTKLETRLISRDSEEVSRYEKDPLVYKGRVFARQGREIILAINRANRGMERISLPLLILHGTSDGLADVDGSKKLYSKASSLDKTIKLYDGFFHEVLNEIGKEEVWTDVLGWLDKHGPAS